MTARTITYAVIIAITVLAFIGDGIASEKPSEDELKAAFLYKFAKFVHWPDDTLEGDSTDVTVGVINRPELREVLEQAVEGKTVRGRPLRVLDTDQPAVDSCRILFIGACTRDTLPDLLAACISGHVLTVSDTRGFATAGGVINFYTHKSKVRFEINPESAERSGLTVSARIMRLARIVTTSGRSEDR